MATGWALDSDLTAIAIPPLVQRVRTVVSQLVHTERIATATATSSAGADSNDVLYGLDGQQTILQPALQTLRGELSNKAFAYACLVNRHTFQREALRDPAAAGILCMRADVCEWLAKVAVEAYRGSLTDLLDVLTFDFSPRQGPSVSQAAPLITFLPTISVHSTLSRQPWSRASHHGSLQRGRRLSDRYGSMTRRYGTNDGAPALLDVSYRSPHAGTTSPYSNNGEPLYDDEAVFGQTAQQAISADASSLAEYAMYDTDLSTLHEDEERASALEMAVRCDARRFCAGPVVQRVVERIWRGDVAFHDNLLDDAPNTAGSRGVHTTSAARSRTAINVRRGRSRRIRDVLRVSRLRVPRYLHLMHLCVYSVFVYLYTRVITARSSAYTAPELLLCVLAIGYLVDGLLQAWQSGVHYYTRYLWQPIDSLCNFNLMLFIGLRFISLQPRLTPSAATQCSEIAYGLLACNAVLVWLRLLSLLDRYRWVGRRMAILRRACRRLAVAAVPILFVLAGFTHAFYALCNGPCSLDSIFWVLVRTATGSPEVGFAHADAYHPILGRWLMLAYLLVAVGVGAATLLSVAVHAYAESAPWSDLEYRFRYTVRVLKHVKGDRLMLPLVPPLNLLFLPLVPLRHVLSPYRYARIQRLLLRLLFWPVLLLIYAYEGVWRRRSAAFGGSTYGGGVGGSGYEAMVMVADETAGRLSPAQPATQDTPSMLAAAAASAAPLSSGTGSTAALEETMRALQERCQQMDELLQQLAVHKQPPAP